MAKNFQSVSLDGYGSALVSITGVTNATYKQLVAIEIDDQNGPRTQEFSGSGENKPMKGYYAPVVALPATVNFTFSFSKGTALEPAKGSQQEKVYDAPHLQVYKVSAEDSLDGDYNDAIMYMSVGSIG